MQNIAWFLSYSKIFPVKASDSYWRQLVIELINQSEVVVLYLSDMSDNMFWELETAKLPEFDGKCIYIVTDLEDRSK
jgi:hypothetical protein